ncbi:MAG: hypothetical protein DGJ47_000585 [Rickettsiaceae bacterium]
MKNIQINRVKSYGDWENSDTQDIKYIIIHDIKFELEKAIDIFNDYGISSHFYIKSNGENHQLVPLSHSAYHAGPSEFSENKSLNSMSIGIETESKWDYQASNEQISSLISLITDLTNKYQIQNVLSHAEIAPYRLNDDGTIKPGKTDPGINFPWKKLAENGIGTYHNVEIKKSPKIIAKFNDESKLISEIQNNLYDYGYTLTPQHGKYDLKTAAVLNAFYLRYYPEWFYTNQEAIKTTIINEKSAQSDLTHLASVRITDQWLLDNLDYLLSSNIDENTILIMQDILNINKRA